MKPKASLPCSQGTAAGSSPEPDESIFDVCVYVCEHVLTQISLYDEPFLEKLSIVPFELPLCVSCVGSMVTTVKLQLKLPVWVLSTKFNLNYLRILGD
jgi:hypothetical protein